MKQFFIGRIIQKLFCKLHESACVYYRVENVHEKWKKSKNTRKLHDEERVGIHSRGEDAPPRRPSIDRHLAFINTFHSTPIILLTRHAVKEETLNCNHDVSPLCVETFVPYFAFPFVPPFSSISQRTYFV